MKGIRKIYGAKILGVELRRGISHHCGKDYDILVLKTSAGTMEIEACKSRINVFLDGRLVYVD